MTPLFSDRFWDLWDDVFGLSDFTVGRLNSVRPEGLPRYLPLFQHRYLRLAKPFDGPVIALRLFDVVGKRRDGTYAPKFPTGAALRTAYNLHKDTRILLVGVDDDGPLETFWSEHRIHNISDALANLDLLGVTSPNFSFFTCVPRFQILRNRKRILLSSERLSNAGVRVAVHLNANTLGDWKFWGDFLKEHSECAVVTMEFQTGARALEEIGREAFDQLFRLQNSVGRPIHPILVGAGRYYREAMEKFDSFTVIDSQPFLQTVSRQILVRSMSGRYSWKESPTEFDGHLDELLNANLHQYEGKLLAATSDDESVEPLPDPRQLLLDGMISTPYLTAQPEAPTI